MIGFFTLCPDAIRGLWAVWRMSPPFFSSTVNGISANGNFFRNLVWEGSTGGRGSFLKRACRGTVIISDEAIPVIQYILLPETGGHHCHLRRNSMRLYLSVQKSCKYDWNDLCLVLEFPSVICFSIYSSYILSSVRDEIGRVYFQCQICLRLKFTRS